MNIAIIGTGGVGGFFGGKLTQVLNNNENKIYFIARNEHLKKIKNNGLILKTQDCYEMNCIPTYATDDISELPQIDFCLICVKSYDLENVLLKLKSKIHDSTYILPLLNGINIYEKIRAIIKNGFVFPSCVYVGTHIEKPGIVAQKGGSCTIFFGPDPQNTQTIPQEIFNLFNSSKIKYEWSNDVYKEIWGKYIFIASFGLVTASENKTIGEVLADQLLLKKVEGIMKEVFNIAQAKNIHLASNIIEESINKGKGFPFNTKTSFQRDFEDKEKKNESEIFGDTIINLGKQLNIKTDVSFSVFEKMKV